jgi:hypothetical protein
MRMSHSYFRFLPLVTLAAAMNCGEEDSCFVRGTRVLTPSGWRPIDTLRVGDEVISCDPTTRTLFSRKVAEIFVAHAPRVARIEAGELSIAGVSFTHPVWDDTTKKWTQVAELSLSATVLAMLPGATVRRLPLTRISALPEVGPIEVFNLHVSGDVHTYFAEGILVHNKGSEPVDGDLDGYYDDEDCDDSDRAVNPGADPVCGDGIDNNCSLGEGGATVDACPVDGSGGSGGDRVGGGGAGGGPAGGGDGGGGAAAGGGGASAGGGGSGGG